eukprot:TRINITY_DN25686_c0_g1_i1.p1 TRINITY_DN25686_c0_g1~~TRINITY_DN25686_c0_g1_i1.p1  ORF type:complete len:384 (+),score=101.75 TRINITY_DN25686_c0_g1_i1:147-1298(+)
MGLGPSLEDIYYQQKVKLGEGGYGTVWRAVDRKTNKFAAIKQLDKLNLYVWQGVKRADILNEIEILSTCQHENVIKLYHWFEDSRFISLGLEYCDGGDLEDKLKERGWKLREREAANWMRQICSAISALFTKSICHRDIKPGNFMLARGTVKLADFGLATFLGSSELLSEKCGTPAFMAPEQQLLGHVSFGYGFPVDVWAAGITLNMLLSGGQHPFLTYSGTLDMPRLLRGTMSFGGSGLADLGDLVGLKSGYGVTEAAKALCRKMVEPDPMKRISIDEALQADWLNCPGSESDEEANTVPELTDPARHLLMKLKQQLSVAEQQVKAAEEREVQLLARLARNDDRDVTMVFQSSPPRCLTGCCSSSREDGSSMGLFGSSTLQV